MLTGQLGEVEARDCRLIRKGLPVIPRKARQDINQTWFNNELVVICVEQSRNITGIPAFVEVRVVEADGKRLDAARCLLSHGRDDRTRVDAAGEERAHRNVTAKSYARRIENCFLYELTRFVIGERSSSA